MPIQPKPVEIECNDGTMKSFVLHKLPAIEGREIVTQYPLTALPKVAEYKSNETIMLKLLAFVGVQLPDGPLLMLTTPALVNNHVPDFECLMRLEAAMLEYNCSFFANGKLLTFFDAIIQKGTASISKMLTGLSQSSSPKDSPQS